MFYKILAGMELKADEGPAPLNDNADSLSDTTFGSSFRQHFLFAINHVFNEPCFAGLFIGEDADCIDKFAKLSGKISLKVIRFRKCAVALPKSVSKVTEIVPVENLSSSS